MFAEKLKELRESKITQREFAKLMCVSQSTIAMWETNRREPDFETVKRLAEYFNVSTDYLLGKSETPNPQKKQSELIRYNENTKEFEEIENLPPDAQKALREYYEMLVAKYINKGGKTDDQ